VSRRRATEDGGTSLLRSAMRHCYSHASDWDAELAGEWLAGPSRCAADPVSWPFSCRAANRTAQRVREVDGEASQRWHASACFAEDTVHSCIFHDDPRARDLAKLTYQPHNCNLLPFDGQALARRHPGMRIVFLGDSMMRQLFVSFVCQLAASLGHRRPPELSWIGPHDSRTAGAPRGRQNGWNSMSNCPFEANEHCYATSGCAFFEGLGDVCLVVKTVLPRLTTEAARELFKPCGEGLQYVLC